MKNTKLGGKHVSARDNNQSIENIVRLDYRVRARVRGDVWQCGSGVRVT